jgi:DNA-binding GntR family transcriptional regulator
MHAKARANTTDADAQPPAQPIVMDVLPVKLSAATLSQTVARALAEDIVTGRLLPGRKLDENTLGRRFGVSRSPVRDALRELVAMGFVRYLPRRGFSVIQINAEELDDLFEAASEIEALCARLCALQADTGGRTLIDSIHQRGRLFARKRDAVSYAACNEELHAAIYDSARNRTIHEVASSLRQQLAPFRARIFYTSERIKTSCAEHDDIVSAILAHDGDKAAESMRQHLARAALNVIQHFRSR